jgi:hypothetical protein
MNPNFSPTYDDNFQHLLTTSKLHTNGKHIKEKLGIKLGSNFYDNSNMPTK